MKLINSTVCRLYTEYNNYHLQENTGKALSPHARKKNGKKIVINSIT